MKHNQTLRRGLGILIALIMCLSLLPVTALAEGTETRTADFTEEEKIEDSLGMLEKNGGEASWDGKTLTLNGVNFTTTADIAVRLPNDTTIVLNGTNTITAENTYNIITSSGITAVGDLTIKGNGTLTVTSGESGSSDGIIAGSYWDNNNNSFVGGNITIYGGTINATGGKARWGSYGIHAAENVTISGGTVNAEGGEANGVSRGIFAYENVNISGGTITATGGEAEYSDGIYADNDVTISGGSVTANGGEAEYSDGIYADNDVTISGGTVTATGGEVTGYYIEELSYAVYSDEENNDEEDSEPAESYGIESYDGKIIISGGHVIAEGVTKALNMKPTLVDYKNYCWRIKKDSVFNEGDFDYNNQTYVEVSKIYTVTVNGAYSSHYGNEPGETFTLDRHVGDYVGLLTGVREGYTLKDLTLDGITEEKLTWAGKDFEDVSRGFVFTMPNNNVTITINWTKNDSDDSDDNRGSGSSYSLEQITSDSKNDVNADANGGGKVKIDKKTAGKGSTVTITVTPDEGCELVRLVVTDKYGDVIDVVDQGNGEYTFIMPTTKVNVEAYFTTAAEPEAVERTMILTIGDTAADVNGENVENDVAPVIRNERTMLPVRFVAEALGAEVAWDETAQKVTITKGDTVIEIYINQPFAFVNNESIELDSPAFIENGRTYLPLRFIVENLGAEVTWDAETQKVIIKY